MSDPLTWLRGRKVQAKTNNANVSLSQSKKGYDPLKQWRNSYSPRARKAVWSIAIAYVIVIVIYVFVSRMPDFQKYIGMDAQDFWFGDSFSQSFSASLLEDIIFFGIVGLALFFATLHNPQDHAIDSRIWYLFSNDKATDAARNYNKRKIHKLALFVSEGFVQISFVDVKRNDDGKAAFYRIEGHYSFLIRNMFSNIPFRDEEIKIYITPDKVDVAGGVRGRVTMLRTTKTGIKPGIDIKDHIENSVPIEDVFEKYFEVSVEPNGDLRYEVKYWIYIDPKEPFHFVVQRYSENLDFYVKNTTNTSLTLSDVQIQTKKPGKELETKVISEKIDIACNSPGDLSTQGVPILKKASMEPAVQTFLFSFGDTPEVQSSDQKPKDANEGSGEAAV